MFASATEPTESVLAGAPTIMGLDVDSRLAFLRKTYALFTVGLGTAAVGAGLGTMYPPLPLVGKGGVFAIFIAFLVGGFVVHMLRKVPVVNVLAFCAYLFTYGGVIVSSWLSNTLYTHGQAAGMANIATAFLSTTIAFGGLTAYVFISRKDFSFLYGFIAFSFFGLVGLTILNIFFPFGSTGLLAFNALGLVLAGVYVLYTTSNILHHYASDEWVGAALCLAMDFIYMFLKILQLLNSRR